MAVKGSCEGTDSSGYSAVEQGEEAGVTNSTIKQPHLVHNMNRGAHDEKKERLPVPTEHLHRQVYILWLVLAYAAMLCTAWIILAFASKRPFGRASYNCYDSSGQCQYSTALQALQNSRTQRLVADAQTLLSAVSLLTIPLTSAVCAAAAVPWMQHCGRDMSIRQTMALADKGWQSPYIYWRLLSWSGWKRYGSPFIGLALLLNAMGRPSSLFPKCY